MDAILADQGAAQLRLIRQILMITGIVLAPWLFGTVETWSIIVVLSPVYLSAILGLRERWIAKRLEVSWPNITPLPWLMKIPVLILLLLPLLQALNRSHYVSPTTGAIYPVDYISFLPSTADRLATLKAWPSLLGCMLVLFTIPGLFLWPHPRRSRNGGPRRMPGVLPVISRPVFVQILVVNVMLISFFALFQRFAGAEKIFGLRDVYFRNFYGPFIYENHAGQYLNLFLPIALGVAIMKWEPNRELGSSSHPLWIMAAVLIAVGTFFSQSRGAIVFGALGLFFFWIIQSFFKRQFFRAFGSLLIGVIVLTTSVWMLGPESVLADLGTIQNDLTEYSDNSRWQSYQVSWEIIRDHPVFGTGLNTWPSIFTKYQPVELPGYWQTAHSDPLEFVCEMGWLGAALMLCLGIGIIRAWSQETPRRSVPVVCGTFAGFIALFGNSFIDFPFAVLAIAIATAAVLAPIRRPPPLPEMLEQNEV
jgi:O-antigen ligase